MNQTTQELEPNFGDGNEAVAWAAEDANVNFVSYYAGAPVNRVAEILSSSIAVNHALNEHIAALATMGASLCGARSLLVMKHVGLNVAADPLNYAGAVKITCGMVVVVGTDPGARSSTGEEDVHWYAPQFNLPLLEPVSVQGIYEAVTNAYQISEQTQLPVLVFVPGRLAYQSSLIRRQWQPASPAVLNFTREREALINVGKRAVKNHREQFLRMAKFALEPPCIQTVYNPDSDFGIITRGATYAVAREAIEDLKLTGKVHLLNVERTHPLHLASLLSFAQGKSKLVVIEDQDGFLETMLKREVFGAVSCPIHGKDVFPAWGEISYNQVLNFLKDEFDCQADSPDTLLEYPTVPDRLGACCEGCPHRPTLFAIRQELPVEEGIIGGDIGCSSLPPHRTDWLLCMNAGIGLSQGIAQMLPRQPLVSTGGDGSLFHAGLLSLQSAVENGLNLTHVVLDNQSIAMTGHQKSPTGSGQFDVRGLLRAIGVRHIFEVDAFMPSMTRMAIRKANAQDGVKVIWIKGACALKSEAERLPWLDKHTLRINPRQCGSCSVCYAKLQCPAIVRSATSDDLSIDTQRCRRCGTCLDVCPNNAILMTHPLAPLVSKLMAQGRALRRLSFRIRNR